MRGARGSGATWMVNESSCVSPVLNRMLDVSSYLPGASESGSANRIGMRRCSPVGIVALSLPVTARGRPSDHRQSHVTVSRESLITMICFATVSPGWKL